MKKNLVSVLILIVFASVMFYVLSKHSDNDNNKNKGGIYTYIGKWEWEDGPNNKLPFPYWRPPGDNTVGVIDLRTKEEQGKQGANAGYGIFAYLTPQSNPLLLVNLGNKLDSDISDETRASLEMFTKQKIKSKIVREVIKEMVINSGQTITDIYINDTKL